MTVEDYIEAHSEAEHPYLHALWRATHLHLNYPRMASGHVQGQVLRMLVQMIRPQTVLEIGTFTGYSALAMASALEPGAMLHTLEISDEQEVFTRPWIEQSPWADRVHFHIGDALELLADSQAGLPVHFDLVFIDADKRHYLDYYEAVLPRVSEGGFILADNTLWGGQVIEAELRMNNEKMNNEQLEIETLKIERWRDVVKTGANAKESQLMGICAFNDVVAADERVEKVILPLRDGLTIIRKRNHIDS